MSDNTAIHPIKGIRLSSCAAGIRYKNRPDLALIEISPDSNVAAVFTQNAFCAAPVVVSKHHLEKDSPRYLLINSGNANAGTGAPGLSAAEESCSAVANKTFCHASQVLPFSTGVIGEPLPVQRIVEAVPQLVESLQEGHWESVARCIMTTDTRPKIVSVQKEIEGQTITVTGIAKGAGMICPNMATMLAYVATDAAIEKTLLKVVLKNIADVSFNAITVDGDTSTNDSCVLIATGKSSLPELGSINDAHYADIYNAIKDVCVQLAKAIVLDGEGATKFVTIAVEHGRTEKECKQVAMTIANSPLVKTALFASDPNWGRILAAIGRAGVDNLDVNKIDIYLGDTQIVNQGARDPHYTEKMGQAVMSEKDITIRVILNRGAHKASVWTCDFSYDYVKINAEYRT